jgi:hypothetical protein
MDDLIRLRWPDSANVLVLPPESSQEMIAELHRRGFTSVEDLAVTVPETPKEATPSGRRARGEGARSG